MDRIMVIDCGKDETKVVVRNNDGSLTKSKTQTRVAEYSELASINKVAGADLHIVEYDGKAYTIGDPSSRTSSSNSKMDDIHKIMTLASIAMNVNNGDYVKVAIGCPLSVYVNKEERDKYLDFILPQGNIAVKVDGAAKQFNIVFRACFAESLGALFLYPEMFKNSIVGVVDIGGLNINCAYFDNGKLAIENCFTDKYGKLEIAKQLKSDLNQHFDAKFKDFEILRAMENGFVQNAEEESAEIISKAMDKDLVDIEEACKDNGWNTRFCKLVFIGGTSQLMADRIMAKYPKAVIPENSGFVNAEGFMKGLCLQLRIQ